MVIGDHVSTCWTLGENKNTDQQNVQQLFKNVHEQCRSSMHHTTAGYCQNFSEIWKKAWQKLAYIIIRHELTGRLNAGGSSCQD